MGLRVGRDCSRRPRHFPSGLGQHRDRVMQPADKSPSKWISDPSHTPEILSLNHPRDDEPGSPRSGVCRPGRVMLR